MLVACPKSPLLNSCLVFSADSLCDLIHLPYFDLTTSEECQPPCRVLHSKCGKDFKCHCLPGFRPTYLPAPILSSRPPTLVYCQSLVEVSLPADIAMSNGVAISDPPEQNGTIVPMSYYPGMTAVHDSIVPRIQIRSFQLMMNSILGCWP